MVDADQLPPSATSWGTPPIWSRHTRRADNLPAPVRNGQQDVPRGTFCGDRGASCGLAPCLPVTTMSSATVRHTLKKPRRIAHPATPQDVITGSFASTKGSSHNKLRRQSQTFACAHVSTGGTRLPTDRTRGCLGSGAADVVSAIWTDLRTHRPNGRTSARSHRRSPSSPGRHGAPGRRGARSPEASPTGGSTTLRMARRPPSRPSRSPPRHAELSWTVPRAAARPSWIRATRESGGCSCLVRHGRVAPGSPAGP